MYSVLIVDDKEIFCRVVARMSFFQSDDSEFKIVHSAHNGIDALNYLRSNHVDVTLADIRMPLMNGLELLKTIKNEKLCEFTVLMSEYTEFSYAKEGLINGAFDYLIKPIKSSDLQSTFGRIKDYFQKAAKESFSDTYWAGKLSRSVLSGDRDELEPLLKKCRESIPGDPEKIAPALDTIMDYIRGDVCAELPYITLYIPMEKICSVSAEAVDADSLKSSFERCLLFLQDELKKFRLLSNHSQIRDIWHYTLSNIEGSCQLQDAAEKFYMNKNYLSTLFRKETGLNYKSFVLQFKVERAKQLLSYSGMKIPVIADALSFNDTEYFSRVFKKHTGISPGKYSYDDYIRTSRLKS